MIRYVTFPKKKNQRYYDIHYQFIRNMFEHAGVSITDEDIPEIGKTAFKCIYNEKPIIFNFADNGKSLDIDDIPVFVFHYKESECKNKKNHFPFSSVSFYDWPKYFKMVSEITYKAKGIISCRQRPYAGALERRQKVQDQLIIDFGENVKIQILEQEKFWYEINNLLCYVHVPGQNNSMADRATMQYFGLGCLVITPYLPEIIPQLNKDDCNMFIDRKHYIKCADDYSDLKDIINDIWQHQQYYIGIANKAKELFINTCIPEKLIEWIEHCLKT